MVAVWWEGTTTATVMWSITGAAAVAVVVASLVANARQPTRRLQGWWGHAPFVFLSIAAGTAMVLSAATVAGVTAWLERPGAPENVALDGDVQAALDAADTLRRPVQITLTDAAHLTASTAYRDFAIVSVLGLVALAVFVVVLLLRFASLRRTPVPDVPGGQNTAGPELQPGRHTAALAQRAERVVGAVATIFFCALAASLPLRGLRETLDADDGPVWRFMTAWAGPAIGLAAGLLFASVVLAGSKKSLTRPWGLLWDLMCFLPRAAHPFAPPCYAERAVPELRSRIDSWLGGLDVDEKDRAALPPRSVILSAHSLGAVLAVGALLSRWDAEDGTGPWDPRIALLTYGTQLRAFFGRFFPELFGPGVLGTQASLAARPWAADPVDPGTRNSPADRDHRGRRPDLARVRRAALAEPVATDRLHRLPRRRIRELPHRPPRAGGGHHDIPVLGGDPRQLPEGTPVPPGAGRPGRDADQGRPMSWEPPIGFEPMTPCLQDRCSGQLS